MGKSWMFQLLSVACLSLAAKMVEVDVPLLLDLQVAPDCLFEPRTILRMELLVLTTLEWRTDSVTPFSYIEYFIVKCRVLRHNTHEFLDRITDLILQSVKDLKFASHPSSAVAAASFLCSTKEMFPSEFEEYKMIIFSLLPSSIQDASIECLDLMIEQFYLSSRMSLLKAETCIDSTPLSPAGVLDASFSTDSDSTFRSVKSEQSTQILCPALKKRRVENICMNVIDS
ncbi:hypothetical protein KP509_1Z120100 [Ceratopteris richardii]|nr:hypothetical protein KP509_1Z120100 [Ceratopteris richardii]